jgi:hypothetical protein
MRLTTRLPAGGQIASTAQLPLKTCPRFLELRRLLFVSDAASPKHRAKESTTKCPPRDIHPQSRMRPHARASPLPKGSVAAQRKCRKFGPNPTTPKSRYHCNINCLVAGWGARIRTQEWRNASKDKSQRECAVAQALSASAASKANRAVGVHRPEIMEAWGSSCSPL